MIAGVSNFKKLLMAGTAIIAVLTMPAITQAATVVVSGADVLVVADPAFTPAISFLTPNIATINTGLVITGTVITNTNGAGTLTFSGTGTVTGAIGSAGKSLGVINAGVGGIVNFNSNIDSKAVNLTGINAVNFKGNITGAVSFGNNDGIITLANNKTIVGTVDSGSAELGTLTLSGAGAVTGTIGLTKQLKVINVGTVGASTFTGAVNASTINITGTGSVVFNSTVNATAINTTSLIFGGAGSVTFNGAVTLTNNLDFADKDATVILGAGVSITKNIDNTLGAGNKGTLTLSGGVQTIIGNIGATKSIKVINAGATGGTGLLSGIVKATTINVTGLGAVTFSGVVTATAINFKGAGSLTFGVGATATGAVDFADNDGTFVLGNAVNLTNNVDNKLGAGSKGTLTLQGGIQTLTGNVGATQSLKVVNLGAIGATSTIKGTTDATNINATGTGAVTLTGAVNGVVSMGTASSATFGSSVTGNLSYGGAGALSVTSFLTGNLTVTGTGTTSVTGAVTGAVALGTSGKATFGSSVTGNLSYGGAGALSVTSFLTGNLTVTGTGTTSVTGAVTGAVALGTSGKATFGSSVTGNLSYGGAGALSVTSFLTGNLTVTGTGTTSVTGAVKGIVALGASGNATFGSSVTGNISYGGVGTVSIVSFLTGDLTLSAAGTATVNGLTKGAITMATGSNGTFTGGATGAVSLTGATASFGALTTGNVTLAGISNATLTGGLTGNVSFTGASTLNLTSGNLTGVVDSTILNTGTLTLSAGAIQTVSGSVGGINGLKVVNAGANLATSTFSGSVIASTVNVTGTGTVNFKGNVTGALNYNIGGVANLDSAIIISGATTVTTNNTGKLTLLGSSTMPGAIGGVGLSLGTLDAGALGSFSTFTSPVYATSFNSTSTGSSTFTSSLNATNIAFAADGIMAFNGDVSGAINGTAGVVGAGIGSVIFSTNATKVTSIGTTGILKALTLSGNATTVSVIGGNVKSADILSIGNNILNVSAGSFTMGAAQSLNINILGTTSGKVVSSLSPVLNATSKVNLTINATAYVPTGQIFILVDDLTNAGAGIPTINFTTSNTPMITFTQDAANLSDLVVTATRKGLSTLTTGINASIVGNAMDALAMNGGAALDAIQLNLQTAGNAGNATLVTSILESLVSNADGGVISSNLNLGSITQGINEGRIATIRLGGESFYNIDNRFTGISAGSPVTPNYYSAWMQGYGQGSVQKKYSSYSGYKASIYGAVIGFDTTEIFEDTVFGVSLSAGQTQVKSKNTNKTESDISNYGFSIYSNYDFNDFMFMDSQIGFGYNSVRSRRYDVGGVVGSTATANYNTTQYNAKSVFGIDYWAKSGLIITPTISASYTFLYSVPYKETGAGGVGLKVSSQRMGVFDVGTGINFAYKMQSEEDGSFLKPLLHASYTYDAVGDTMQTTSKFIGGVGSSFTTLGTPIARNRFNGGVGVVYATQSAWAMSLNYDYEYRSQFESHSASLRLTSSF